MKKMIKAAAAVLLTAFVLSFAACSYEAGYSDESPSAPSHPSSWSAAESEAPSVQTPSLSGIDIPSSPSQNNDFDDDDDDVVTGGDYKLMYNGTVVDTISSQDLLALALFFTEGTDYVIDHNRKTVTLTADGYAKMEAMGGSNNDHDDDDFDF